eukprot:1726070-Rhodomonas_salina.1
MSLTYLMRLASSPYCPTAPSGTVTRSRFFPCQPQPPHVSRAHSLARATPRPALMHRHATRNGHTRRRAEATRQSA